MDEKLFVGPKRLPEVGRRIPMYRAMRFASLSHRDTEFATTMQRRVRRYTQLLGFTLSPIDAGDVILFREHDSALEVYRASDSLWWANTSLAFTERPAASRLPTEAEAKRLAARELARLQLDTQQSRVTRVDYNEIAVAEGGRRPRLGRTAVNVNFRFVLGGLPVMGPGAKIKVSFVGNGQVSQVIYALRRRVEIRFVPQRTRRRAA
jgi:hypothetical protein